MLLSNTIIAEKSTSKVDSWLLEKPYNSVRINNRFLNLSY